MPTPHSKERRDLAEFTAVGTPTCRRETRVISTREGKQRAKMTREAHVAACETRSTRSEETERHVIQSTKSEKQVDQVSHSGVGPCSGRISREQGDKGIKDHALAEYPRKFLRSQQTKLR